MKHLKLTQDNGTIFLNTIDNIKNNQKLILLDFVCSQMAQVNLM